MTLSPYSQQPADCRATEQCRSTASALKFIDIRSLSLRRNVCDNSSNNCND